MANTLMFEVGVQEAKGQLTALENRLKDIVDKYGAMKLKVEVENLDKFINALNSIGDGKQLKPLLDRIDSIQSSLTKLNVSMGDVDMSALNKQLKAIEETQKRIDDKKKDLRSKGLESQIPNAVGKDEKFLNEQLRTLEQRFGMVHEVAKNYAKTAGQSSSASSALEKNIKSLSQSINELSSKSFSVNMGSEFKTWTEQVQALVVQVKNLVTQMEKLHSVQEQVSQQSGFSVNSGFSSWVDNQVEGAQRILNAYKDVDKFLKKELNTSTLTYADYYRMGNAEHIKYAQSLLTKHMMHDFGNISDENGLIKLREAIKSVQQAIDDTEKKLAGGKMPAYNANPAIVALEDRLKILKEIEKQAVGTNQASSINSLNQLKERGVKIDEESVRAKNQAIQAQEKLNQVQGQQINVNLGGDFAKWTQEVNGVTTSVRELVEQLKQLHQVQGQGGRGSVNEQNEQLLEQARIVGNLQTQLSKLQNEGLKIPKTADSYKAIEEYDKLFPKFIEEQKKFDEMLQRGATVTGSYAQVIQQLGEKYNFSAEQLQKLTSLIASGDLQRAHVQRGLGIGYNKAEDVVKAIDAVQKLKQEEAKPVQHGDLFNPQKITTLQEAIDKIIGEINRLRESFASIGDTRGISDLHEKFNGIVTDVNTLVEAVSKIGSAYNKSFNTSDVNNQTNAILSQADAVKTLLAAEKARKELAQAKGQRSDIVEQQELANKALREFGLTTQTISDQTKLQAAAEKAVTMEEQARVEMARQELEIRRQIAQEALKDKELVGKAAKNSYFSEINNIAEYLGTRIGGDGRYGRSLMATHEALRSVVGDRELEAEFKEEMGYTVREAMKMLNQHMQQVVARAMRMGLDVSQFAEAETSNGDRTQWAERLAEYQEKIDQKINQITNSKMQKLENFYKLLDAEGSSRDEKIAAAKQDLVNMGTREGKTYQELINDKEAYIQKCNEEIAAGERIASVKSADAQKSKELAEAEKTLIEKVQALDKAQQSATRFDMRSGMKISDTSKIIAESDKALDIVQKLASVTRISDRSAITNSFKDYLEAIIKTSPNAQERIQSLRNEIEKLTSQGYNREKTTLIGTIDQALSKISIPNIQKEVEAQYSKLMELRQKMQEPIIPTVHGNIIEPQVFTAMQKSITDITSEINRLRTAFADTEKDGVKFDGITSSLLTLKDVLASFKTFAETLPDMSKSLKFTGNPEEISAYETKIKSLQEQIAQLEKRAKSLGEVLNITNTEIKSIGESKGSEVTLNKNLDKLQAALENVKNSLTTIQPKYDMFKAAGLSDQELEGKYNRLIKIKEALEQAMNNKELMAKPGAISSIKLAGEDIMALGEMTKELRSAKGAEKLAADFERLAVNAEMAKKSMQGYPSADVKKLDGGAIEEYVEHNKDVLRKWREFVRDTMKVLYADIKDGFTGMDKSNLWEMYRGLRQKFGSINKQVTGETMQDPERMLAVMKQYKALVMEINSARIQQSDAKQNWAESNEYRMREAAVAYAYLKERVDSFLISRDKLSKGGQDTSGLDAMIQKAREFLFILDKMRTNGFYGDLRLGDILKSADFRTIAPNGRDEIRQLMEQYKAQGAAQKEADQYAKQAQKENEKWADSMDFAKKKANELQNTIKNLEGIRSNVKVGVDTSSLTAEIDKLKNNLSTLYAMMGGAKMYGTSRDFVSSSLYANPLANAKGYARDIQQSDKSIEKTADNLAKVDNKLVDVNNKLETYDNLIKTAGDLKINTSGLDTQKQKVAELQSLLEQIQTNKGVTNDGRNFVQVMREYGQYIKKADNEAKSLQKTVSGYMKGFSGNPSKDINTEITRTTRLLRELESTQNKGKIAGIELPDVSDKIVRLKDYLALLEKIRDAGTNYKGNTVYTAHANNASVVEQAKAANEAGKLAIQSEKAAHSVSTLSESEQRLAQAIGHSTNEMKGQSQVMSDLKMLATQYISIWGLQSLWNSIKDTGGLLEQQRLSLSAIIGDISRANDLFGKVKDLAVRSPFGVVQIDQMTKQLAAYGFEYNELFDWTKRLGDISAATGTSVDRLALALGHVRSEGALSGYTLRQFAMGNVPLLRMLSESRGVSTKEIRDLVRKKEISDKEVQDVLLKLTNEGGMFYNAQDVMSEALNAKFKNLKDSFDIMFGEIAEGGVGSVMKEIAVGLTEISKRWKTFGTIVLSSGLVFGTYKLGLIAVNAGMNANAAAMLKGGLNLSSLTAKQVKHLAVTKQITREQLVNAVATKQLTYQQASLAANYFVLDKQMMKNIGTMGRFKLAMKGIASSSVVSMLVSPWTALLLAIEAVVGAVMQYKSWSSNIESDVNSELDLKRSARRDIKKYTDERKGSSKPNSNKELQLEIEHMKSILKNSELYTKELEEQVALSRTISEEYDVLNNAIINASDNLSKMNDDAELLTDAIKASSSELSTWGSVLGSIMTVVTAGAANIWGFVLDKLGIDNFMSRFNDWVANEDINENVKDLQKSMMGLKRQLSVLDEYRDKMSASAKSLADSGVHAEMANYPLEEQIRILAKDEDAWEKFVQGASDGSEYFEERSEALRDAANEVASDWEEITNDDIPRMMKNLAKQYNMDEEEFKKYAQTNKIEFANMLDTMLAKAKERSPEIAAQIKKAFFGWVNGEEDYHLEPKVETEEEKRERERKERLKKRIETVKKYGEEGKRAMRTLTNYSKKHGKGDKNGNGLFDINWIGKYFEAGKGYKEPFEKIGKDYKDVKEQLKSAKSAGDKALATKLQKQFNLLDIAVKAFGIDIKEKKGSKEDKEAKRLREIAKLYKDAYNWYKKYEKQLGEDQALFKVKEQFQPLFDEFNKEWKTHLSIDNIPEYKKNLKGLLKEAQDLYKQPKHRNNYMVDAIKEFRDAINDVDFTELETKSQKFVSAIKNEIDSLTRSWDIFNSVREATGNIDLAKKISGANYENGKTRNLADDLKSQITESLQLFDAKIKFDIELSDKDVDEKIKKLFNNRRPLREDFSNDEEGQEKYEKKLEAHNSLIQGYIDLYIKWRDLQRDVLKNDIKVFADLVGGAQDYESQIRKINDKLEETISSLKDFAKNNPKKKNETEQAIKTAEINADDEKWKLSLEYSRLMNNSLVMTREEVENGLDRAVDILNQKMQNNVISAKEYGEEMEKILGIYSDWQSKSFFGAGGRFAAFAKGGGNLSSLISYQKSKAKDSYANYADLNQKYGENDIWYGNAVMKAKKKAQGDTDELSKLENLDLVLSDFQALAKVMDPVISLFDDLGMTELGSVLSMGQDALNAASSSGASAAALFGASAGPWGAAIGAGMSVFSSVMSMHDNYLQEEIDALKDLNTAIESNTKVIQSLRERSLGYDNSNLRRSLAEMYNDTTRKMKLFGVFEYTGTSAALQAMKDYYGKNSSGNGYSQELNNMMSERKNYIEMYDKEKSKKKTSQSALEEYKAKIAELDEQIMYFTQDLANELWGIDVKGWSDQISDALWTAFENGEDAVKAFGDTATDIVSQVAKKMGNLGIIEPMMKQLQTKLFGNINPNTGMYDNTGAVKYKKDANGNYQIDMEGSQNAIAVALGEAFGNNGYLSASVESLEAFYKLMEKLTGMDFSKNKDNSSKVIQGNFSEDEIGLLLSYLNAIRADVSVNRMLIEQYFPMYYEALTSSNRSLSNIEANTAAIMRSNDEIRKSNDAILSRIDGLRNKTWKMPIE